MNTMASRGLLAHIVWLMKIIFIFLPIFFQAAEVEEDVPDASQCITK